MTTPPTLPAPLEPAAGPSPQATEPGHADTPVPVREERLSVLLPRGVVLLVVGLVTLVTIGIGWVRQSVGELSAYPLDVSGALVALAVLGAAGCVVAGLVLVARALSLLGAHLDRVLAQDR